MWPFTRKTTDSKKSIAISVSGLHCVSCGLSIDSALEELPEVHSSSTNYAKGVTTVTGSPVMNQEEILQTVESLGYQARIK